MDVVSASKSCTSYHSVNTRHVYLLGIFPRAQVCHSLAILLLYTRLNYPTNPFKDVVATKHVLCIYVNHIVLQRNLYTRIYKTICAIHHLLYVYHLNTFLHINILNISNGYRMCVEINCDSISLCITKIKYIFF